MSKAWFVHILEDFGDFVHGETQGKAKSMFFSEWGDHTENGFIDLLAVRVPELDNTPINEKSILKYMKGETFEGEPYTYWYPICGCKICKM